MLNYSRYQAVGGYPLLKPNVIPHKFEGLRREVVDQVQDGQCEKVVGKGQENQHEESNDQKLMIDAATQTEDQFDLKDTMSKTSSLSTKQRLSIRKFETVCVSLEEMKKRKLMLHKPVQVNFFKNCQIRPKPCVKSVGCSPIKRWIPNSTLPNSQQPSLPSSHVGQYGEVKAPMSQGKQSLLASEISSDSDESENSDEECGSSYNPETDDESYFDDQEKLNSLIRTRKLIEKAPRIYIGLDKQWLSVVSLLSYKIKYRPAKHNSFNATDVVYLILRKLRLNECFAILANEFGISQQYANQIFNRFLPFVADHFGELIYWPSADSIRKTLPLAFRKSFKKVQGIIDCLEIEIQKPSDAREQALTWSDYKHANTLKYLICITPDGLINFVSEGYGGRTTDEMITSNCGFLDKLKPGMYIMADRGFKKIEHLLVEKGCVLVRPPSVSSDTKLSKHQVLLSRRISGLRIHVERAIRRVREFKFLAPHSCLDYKVIRRTNEAIKIACGLVNLQGPLIVC